MMLKGINFETTFSLEALVLLHQTSCLEVLVLLMKIKLTLTKNLLLFKMVLTT